jgi:uncharacterized Zn finger protein
MRYWGYPEYVTVAEKKARAARKLKELSKKHPNMKPVVIKGSAIACTWWGKAWNRNLEQYADYSNRIGRGRNYVRHGAVLHLQIESGEVNALVQGGRPKPYSVSIKIQTLKKDIWQKIKTSCEDTLESFQGLLAGAFPKALGEIFTSRDTGMFPAPREIKFSCSCPDWASMCKHVAAVLYGVGARLDEDPKLFFRLRDADISTLITQTVTDKTKKLLEKADRKSSRIMEDTDLSAVFGIDIDEPHFSVGLIPVKPPPARKKREAAATFPKRKQSLRMGTEKSGAGKAKKKIAKRPPSKKAKTTAVKKTPTKAGKKHGKVSFKAAPC